MEGKTWEHEGHWGDLVRSGFSIIQGFDARKQPLQSGRQPAVIYQNLLDGGKSWNLPIRRPAAFSRMQYLLKINRQAINVFGDPVDGKWALILKTVNKENLGLRLPNLPEVVAGEAGFAGQGKFDWSNRIMRARQWRWKSSNSPRIKGWRDRGWRKFKSPLIQGEVRKASLH